MKVRIPILVHKTVLGTGLVLILSATSGIAIQTAQAAENKQSVAAPAKASNMQRMNRKEQTAFSIKDLATQLEIGAETIKLSGATSVWWRSGALGCPKPGMSYTQALVPGVLIMLRVDNRLYRYHATPAGQPFYCPDSRAEPPNVNSGDT